MQKQEILQSLKNIKEVLKSGFKTIDECYDKVDVLSSEIKKEIIHTQFQLVNLDKEIDSLIQVLD